MAYPYPPMPKTNDMKWFARKRAGDMTDAERAEFMQEYAPMWAYWQEIHQAFGELHPIWGEAGAPGYNEAYGQPQPTVAVKIHPGEPRSMILVCAGGGFFWKAAYEGPQVAQRFYEEGFNVATLDYRVNPYPMTASFEDAKQAMRYLRAHAAELNTIPDKIGMMGFSAGSMMTGHCATMFREDEEITCRPDAAVLCYGAGSQLPNSAGLLAYNREQQAAMSRTAIERNIRPECPPFFMWQCGGNDDPRNAAGLACVMAECGVPFELHIFPGGHHGMGLADEHQPDASSTDPHVAKWVPLCCEWLRNNGF